MGFENEMGLNTDIGEESQTEESEGMDQDESNVPKNVFVVGSEGRDRLSS